eukprot:Nk52_evm27s359 gene=Nk52_evmTU27s359
MVAVGSNEPKRRLAEHQRNHLCQAIERNDIRLATKLLKNGIKNLLDVTDPEGNTALHRASLSNKVDLVELFIEKGASPYTKNNAGWTPLFVAADKGHIMVVSTLLKYGSDPDDVDLLGRTPLFYALKISNDYIECIEELVTYNANVNAEDKIGQTPLHRAAEVGSVQVMKTLLGYNADVGSIDKSGCTPLHMAALHGKVECAVMLIGKGASIEAKENTYEASPIHWAAAGGHPSVIDALLANGDTIQRKAVKDLTTMHFAAMNGKVECAQYCFKKGVAIASKDDEGYGPQQWAYRKGFRKCGDLIGNKFKPPKGKKSAAAPAEDGGDSKKKSASAKGKKGEEPKKSGGKKGKKGVKDTAPVNIPEYPVYNIIKEKIPIRHAPKYAIVLPQPGRKQNFLTDDSKWYDSENSQRTVSMYNAAKMGDLRSVANAVELGYSVDTCNSFLRTPLMAACYGGKVNVIKFLLSKNANFNLVDKLGWSALHHACDGGQEEAVRLLLNAGLTPNCISNSGGTPLMRAADNGFVSLAELLVSKGADVYASNAKGMNALDIAVQWGNVQMATYLQEQMDMEPKVIQPPKPAKAAGKKKKK